MKIYDNTDEPKVNGYILGNQNHIGFYFDGYVYYFGFSDKAYPRKTHLQNWCKKWVYLNEMCAEKKEEYMETLGWKNSRNFHRGIPKLAGSCLQRRV